MIQVFTVTSDQFIVQTEAGLKLSLGDIAFEAGLNRVLVSENDIITYGFGGNLAVDEVENVGGYFDFTVSGLPVAGQSVQVVVPLLEQMPRIPVYRKLTSTGWQDFVKDENNSVESAAGAEGYCPPPGDPVYQPGLNQGHWCIQLTIEDGGPNDNDGTANNSITNPGGVARFLTDVSVTSSGGGGGATNPLLLVLSLFVLLCFRNIKHLERQAA